MFHRRSLRLPGYDYSQPGAYFVTLCTWLRKCIFGVIEDGMMQLNQAGQIAQKEWIRLGMRFPNADITNFVIMPNHVHGVVAIGKENKSFDIDRTTNNSTPQNLVMIQNQIIPGSLGAIIRAYKAFVSLRLHVILQYHGPIWQRNYYEHIISNELDLQNICEYIELNPYQWEQDRFFGDRIV
jgi:putative transposase